MIVRTAIDTAVAIKDERRSVIVNSSESD